MGCVNKNYPLTRRVVCLKEAKRRRRRKKEKELSAFVFLQKVAAFAGRVHSENNNHRYKND
jgi:hypothetical protein